MSNLSLFMKQNKKQRPNIKFVATKDLVDENGQPLEWELKPLTTKQNQKIRESCTTEVQVPGKKNLFIPKVDTNKYLAKLVAEAVVYPDLYNKELQDSYGVMSPEELLQEMVDNAGEYNSLVEFIQKVSGFDISLSDKVDEAKN